MPDSALALGFGASPDPGPGRAGIASVYCTSNAPESPVRSRTGRPISGSPTSVAANAGIVMPSKAIVIPVAGFMVTNRDSTHGRRLLGAGEDEGVDVIIGA